MELSEITFLLLLFSASASKLSTLTEPSVPWEGTDRGLGGFRIKQFGKR